jgi:hypothetical protein
MSRVGLTDQMQTKAYTGKAKTDETNGINRYDEYCFKPRHFFCGISSICRVHNNWVINKNV